MNTFQALEILGLDETPSLADIKKAYRQQVKIWHPDRYSEGSPLKRLAEKNIQDANLAYAHLKRQLTGALRNHRPTSLETKASPGVPPPAPGAVLRQIENRLLVFLRSIDPSRALGCVRHWLQGAPQRRFTPWYRYPASSAAPGEQKRSKSFDHILQDAMQNRTALKRLHRARHRSSGRQKDDKVMPITAIAKCFKPGGDPSSGSE